MATERKSVVDDKETGSALRCPKCKAAGSVCRETKQLDEGRTVRRRRCVKCRAFFDTVEMLKAEAEAALITAVELAEIRSILELVTDSSNTIASGQKILRGMMAKLK